MIASYRVASFRFVSMRQTKAVLIPALGRGENILLLARVVGKNRRSGRGPTNDGSDGGCQKGRRGAWVNGRRRRRTGDEGTAVGEQDQNEKRQRVTREALFERRREGSFSRSDLSRTTTPTRTTTTMPGR